MKNKVETLIKALEFFYTIGDKVAIDEIKKIFDNITDDDVEKILKTFLRFNQQRDA